MNYSIRFATRDDARQLADLYNYYIKNSIATFDLNLMTTEDREVWIEDHQPSSRYKILVAEEHETGKLLGYSSSSPFRMKAAYDTSVETSIYIDLDHYGKGVGNRLYGELFTLLSKEDIHRAYACITVPNESSVLLHEKFGFIEVGYFTESGLKHGAYRDIRWMEKRFSNKDLNLSS